MTTVYNLYQHINISSYHYRIRGHDETIQYRGNLAQNDVFIGDMTITLPVDNNLV